ncbi:MAG TPA: hypothetical protein VIG97_14200 [Luteimonas sp.]
MTNHIEQRNLNHDASAGRGHRCNDPGAGDAPHLATVRARIGPAKLHAKVRISTRGLLAVTGLVAGTLLSAAVIVAVATRKLPEGAMPARMKRSRW